MILETLLGDENLKETLLIFFSFKVHQASLTGREIYLQRVENLSFTTSPFHLQLPRDTNVTLAEKVLVFALLMSILLGFFYEVNDAVFKQDRVLFKSIICRP